MIFQNSSFSYASFLISLFEMGLPHPYLLFSSYLNCSDILFQYFVYISSSFLQYLLPHIWLAAATWLGLGSYEFMQEGLSCMLLSVLKRSVLPQIIWSGLNDRLNSSLMALSNTILFGLPIFVKHGGHIKKVNSTYFLVFLFKSFIFFSFLWAGFYLFSYSYIFDVKIAFVKMPS